MPKPKSQEKYNSRDYVIIEPKVPAIPSAQATGILLTDGAPTAEYQEVASIDRPTHTEIQMDKLGLNVDFSYDVELDREPQHSQTISPVVYTEYHRPSVTHPTLYPQQPSDNYYTPSEAILLHDSYPTAAPHMATDANLYPENMVVNNYFPAPPQPLAESHVQPEYSDVLHPSQVLDPQSSPDMSPQYDFFEEMGFSMPESELFQQPQYQRAQFQPFYHPSANFSHLYRPTLAAH